MKELSTAGREATTMTVIPEAPAGLTTGYPEPLWIQAVNLINGEIEKGALLPGMRLPPERELCLQLGISRVTLRKALNKLVDDGVLSASHGRGWYVAQPVARLGGKDWPNSLESFSETARRMGLTATSTVLRAAEAPATLDEAETLLVAPGTPLFHLDRVRYLNAVAIAVDSTQVPASLAPGLVGRDFSSGSLYEALAAAGVEPLRADATIEAKEADAQTAALLGLEPGKPVLVMGQLAIDLSERPLFSSTIRYAGDRYRLRTFFARAAGAGRH
jgi:GntR family transcriptional regulator